MCYDEENQEDYSFYNAITKLIDEQLETKQKSIIETNASLQKQLMSERAKISELRKQLIELPKLKEIAHKEAVARLFGGFRHRQTIWFKKIDYNHIDCQRCDKSGKVTVLLDGEEIKINCKQCEGRGYISTKVYNPKKSQISSLEYSKWGRQHDPTIDVKIRLDHTDYTYSPKNIYVTEEECKAECDTLNEVE